MGDTFDKVKEREETQAVIVRAELISELEQNYHKSYHSLPAWQKCLPRSWQPRCQDDANLCPSQVLRIVRIVGLGGAEIAEEEEEEQNQMKAFKDEMASMERRILHQLAIMDEQMRATILAGPESTKPKKGEEMKV